MQSAPVSGGPLAASGSPIPRTPALVGDRDDLKIGSSFAIDDEIREAADGNAADDVAESNSGDSSTDFGMLFNQAQDVLDFRPELVPQTSAFTLVANDRVPQFGFGFGIETDVLHLPKISLSILRRTSAQSDVTASPESRAAHRRSISAAQAASTSTSASVSRL